MIEKSKSKNDYGKSFDYELIHQITRMCANVVKVYEYSAFESDYVPTSTWRVDIDSKSKFWGSFAECMKFANKTLKDSLPYAVGSYVKPNKNYFREWDRNHFNHFDEETFNRLKRDEEKRVIKVENISTSGKIVGRFVYLDNKNKIQYGAKLINCYYSDFDKTTIKESWNNLLDIKEAIQKAEETNCEH